MEPNEPIDRLVQAALDGDEDAWRSLMLAWTPGLQAMARGHRDLRRKGLVSDDDIAEVVVMTLERLRNHRFASLRRFLERRREPGASAGRPAVSLDSWLYGALDFSVRTHLRARFGRAPRSDGQQAESVRLSRRDVGSFAERLPEDDRAVGPSAGPGPAQGVTDRLSLVQIRTAVARDFSAEEARAFALHYEQDRGYAEIAEQMGLPDPRAAERMIRRLNARLRYRFDT